MENELPKGWVETNLGEVVKWGSGGTPKTSEQSYYGGKIPWIKTGDLNNRIIEKSKDFITELGLKNSSAKIFPKGSIAIAMYGATIGKTAVFGIDAATNQACAVGQPFKGVSNIFLHYYLKSEKQNFIDKGKGGAQPNISQTVIKKHSFPLPPLAEQQRIVGKLDKLFERMEAVKKRLELIPKLMKAFRQSVLTRAVTGKLTEEWRAGKELEEWEKTNIGKLFSVKTGATPKRGVKEFYENGTIPWLKSGQARNELIFEAKEFITEKAVKETNAKVYPKETLLIAMYGEGKTRGQVGWMKIEAASNQAVAALVNEEMNITTRSFVFYFCLSQYQEIRSLAKGGNQPNLNLSKIKNWAISIPSLTEQQEIVRRVERLFGMADAIEEQYAALAAKVADLPQAILAKAFRGELVEQLDTDGDAKDLLAAIQAAKAALAPKKKAKRSKL